MTINQDKLTQLYQLRPDLQAVYGPDGKALNPQDPRVAGIPTLMDWATKFGIKENPELDPTYETLLQYFTPDQIKTMPDDIRTGLAAFADVQTKNFEAGRVNTDINAANWNDAMAAAANDPEIVAKYGDALKVATQSTTQALKDLEAGYTEQQAATNRQQLLDTKNLAEAEASAGRAYSGFRKQAEDKLKADQADVITSSRRQLKQNLTALEQPFEQKYGSAALAALNPPTIDGQSYTPEGLTGSNKFAQDADIRNKAVELYGVTADPTVPQSGNSGQ